MPEPDDPRIPYVHGRHVVPLRRQTRRFHDAQHERSFVEEDRIRARIHEVDCQLVELTEERRQLLAQLGSLHERLRPRWIGSRGRRRRAVSHEEPVPTTAETPTLLSGRELRAICLGFLQRARGSLSLRQLHVLLHRTGYAVAHAAPVKALADALGHEADAGRVRRVERGVYAVLRTTPTEDTLRDW